MGWGFLIVLADFAEPLSAETGTVLSIDDTCRRAKKVEEMAFRRGASKAMKLFSRAKTQTDRVERDNFGKNRALGGGFGCDSQRPVSLTPAGALFPTGSEQTCCKNQLKIQELQVMPITSARHPKDGQDFRLSGVMAAGHSDQRIQVIGEEVEVALVGQGWSRAGKTSGEAGGQGQRRR